MHWLLIVFVFAFQWVAGQERQLHEYVTNNAVVSLKKDGRTMFYSFFGLDSTKKWSGVHTKLIRYDLGNRKSTTIGNLPDVGRLAAAANVIDNKAYVVGGYTVFESGKEKSSDKLFIFDPETETLSRGANLPVPIDDQVQGVWRNKLLYVISGWSDSLNVNAVQVYNPKANLWQMASSLPDESGARIFGGCGMIAGDTIYVLGGATFAKFYPPSRGFYKGFIDANNPLHITWINAGQYPGEHRYRSASFMRNGKLYFVGGSDKTYNYNGISYTDQKPVEPNRTILVYEQRTGSFSLYEQKNHVMDLRGVVSDEKGKMYTLGGMESDSA